MDTKVATDVGMGLEMGICFKCWCRNGYYSALFQILSISFPIRRLIHNSLPPLRGSFTIIGLKCNIILEWMENVIFKIGGKGSVV